jgi:hypothetical protein
MTKAIRRSIIPVMFILLMAGVVVALSGCPKDPYTASMAASLDVSNGVNDGITVIGQLETDSLITRAEGAKIAGYLGNLTVLNGKFRTTVRSIHTANPVATKAAYIPAAQAFVSAANDPTLLAALHVVNPVAEQRVQAFLTAINTALNGIQLAINQAKGA